jgi:AcrR family transcriptional regulator
MSREPIWLRPPADTNLGRPAELDRAQITTAAVDVAEADGLAAVTMRRVAAELGTASASLYRHLATRDDLVDLMVDRAFERYGPAPRTGDWRADTVAEQLHRLRYLREHPWLLDAVLDRPPVGPAVLAMVEHALGLLADHPAPGPAKMEAIGVLTGLVQTTAQNERPGHGVLDEEFMAAQATILMRAATDGAHPHLAAALAGPPPTETGDERLARILGHVLDGLLPQP